jgi:NAD(P)-dependent dehydrogenase (short-subunit alcohol dehydrogenase family)
MINPMELENRTILVTGASSGIGRETAILLSQLGARLILGGRNSEKLEKTLALLEGTKHQAHAFDLSAVDSIPRWMKDIAGNTGPLHGLVHSAGVQITKPLRMLTSANIDEVMRINITASFGLIKGFRQKGVCANFASVVLISSVMGLVGQSGISAYSASKGALVTLAKSLALELAKENIRVNCVAPAHVHTEMAEKLQETLTTEQIENIRKMHPIGIGNPRDVAYAIAFLLADTGRWITGTTLVVDGGYTAH